MSSSPASSRREMFTRFACQMSEAAPGIALVTATGGLFTYQRDGLSPKEAPEP